jgi:hypothetical protein
LNLLNRQLLSSMKLNMTHLMNLDNYLDSNQKVDVTIDDTNIMIETNSLKALRHVSYRFVESGYILQRDRLTEKMFQKDKLTKYIRVFRILNHTSSICSN